MISVYFFLFMFDLAWFTKTTCTRFAHKFCGILFTIVTLEIMLRRCWTFGHSILKLEQFQLCTCIRYFFNIYSLKTPTKYCKFKEEKSAHTYFSADGSANTFAYLLLSARALYFRKVKESKFLVWKTVTTKFIFVFSKTFEHND